MTSIVRARSLVRSLSNRRIAGLMSGAILLLAAADCWATRHEVFPDGISYMDIGDTVFRHGFQAGANAYWSPAYAWLVGSAIDLVGPSRSDELLLVKAAFVVPVAVACLTCAFLTSGSAGRRALALILTVGACAVVAAPYVTALSRKEGHFTIGESGALNYAWDVDKVTPFLNWQGGDHSFGSPVHPTRRIGSNPPTFVYARPVPGSVPVWYDPYYWYRGVKPRIQWVGQARALALSTLWFLVVEFASLLFLLLVPVVLLARPLRARRPRRRLLTQHAYLAVPAAGLL